MKCIMLLRTVALPFLYFFVLLPLLSAQSHLQVLRGVDDSGRASSLWQEMIAKRLPEDTFRRLEPLARPYTAGELGWVRLVESHLAEWEGEVTALALPFRPVAAPEGRIVLGNRGGDDAFTHDPHTIGFDVGKLSELYGEASSAGNAALMDRLFRHEYTHLLQKAWVRDHPLAMDTPLHAALADMWLEGQGNYYSLSPVWKPSGGKPSAKAAETLARLQPIWLTKLASLACSKPENSRLIAKGLSSGPFDRKWGAVPVALWLEAERADPNALRDFIVGGEDSVLRLASRHLPTEMQPQVEQIRELEKTCSPAD